LFFIKNAALTKLERIREVGYAKWMTEKRPHYVCPQCDTLNSAYDLKCRKCGEEPSCGFAAKHREAVEEAMKRGR
jgi:ribosomal protein L40E